MNLFHRTSKCVLVAVVLFGCTGILMPQPTHAVPVMQIGSSIGKAVLKYFGKEGSEEAAEYMAKKGGREMVKRVTASAARQGDEAVEQVASGERRKASLSSRVRPGDVIHIEQSFF